MGQDLLHKLLKVSLLFYRDLSAWNILLNNIVLLTSFYIIKAILLKKIQLDKHMIGP